jgi:hypothetical protein
MITILYIINGLENFADINMIFILLMCIVVSFWKKKKSLVCLRMPINVYRQERIGHITRWDFFQGVPLVRGLLLS